VLDGLAGSEMVGELAACGQIVLRGCQGDPAGDVRDVAGVGSAGRGRRSGGPGGGGSEQSQVCVAGGRQPWTYTIRGQLAIGQQVADLGAVQVVVRADRRQRRPRRRRRQRRRAEVAEAEATPVPDVFTADAVVSGELLNVRQGPDTAFAKVGQLAQRDALKVLAANSDGTWIRIRAADGTEGWVFAGLYPQYQLADVPVEEVALPTPAPTPEGGAAPPPVAPPRPGRL
jgi:hypothetical protein